MLVKLSLLFYLLRIWIDGYTALFSRQIYKRDAFSDQYLELTLTFSHPLHVQI